MTIYVRRFVFMLSSLAAALILVHLLLYWVQLFVYPDQPAFMAVTERFDVDNEVSIPTWFSQIILFVGALIAAFIGKNAASQRYYWYFIAALLTIMSLDEGATLHETLGVWLGQQWGVQIPLGFAVLRDWVIIAGITVLLAGILLLRFVKSLPKKTSLLLTASAAIFITGALGVETLHFTSLALDPASYAHRVSNATEEGFEMAGVIVAIYALLDYARQNIQHKRISIK